MFKPNLKKLYPFQSSKGMGMDFNKYKPLPTLQVFRKKIHFIVLFFSRITLS